MMKALFAVATLGLAANLDAETLSLDSVAIELPPGWVHRLEEPAPPNSEFGDQMSVRRPEGVGVLYLRTYAAAASVDMGTLRLLTNVPATERLLQQNWGDYSGYRHDYVESGSFHRSWWLARDENVLFITYQCDAGRESVEIDRIEQIVQSLSSASR